MIFIRKRNTTLNGIFFSALFFLLLLSTSAYGEDPPSSLGVALPKVRLEAPPFTLASLEGGSKSLSDYRGSLIVLNFWATWCEPCREEMPSLERLRKRFAGRGLVVITIAADRSKSGVVRRFSEEMGLTLPVLLDASGDVRRAYEVAALPTSYIIGRDGRFSGKIIGAREWDGEGAIRFFEELLGR